MKTKFVLFTCLIIYSFNLQSQTPVALRPDISVSLVMNVQGGAVRLAFNSIDSSYYYATLSGNIYKINIPFAGQATDTLIYSATDHGIPYIQGMVIYDSALYVSGNLNKDTSFTTGIIVRGDLIMGFQRNWSIVAQTVPYETADRYDHLFSGLTLNHTHDTILVCSGARGDHGEIRTRYGQFPGLRNTPLTSIILQVPAAGQNILIPNDTMALDTSGFIFARGIRNTFDFAFNANSDLFGTENSGDRDAEDELNFLQSGKHYGFPWMMGGSYNPQMFSGYDPTVDLLINHNCGAWIDSSFSNDTLFPQIPIGLQLTLPCKNSGPDASFMRDSATGITYNAAQAAEDIYSFTPHRSPLGLTFDSDSILGSDLRGNGFVLSHSGNTLLLSAFNDAGEDLQMLKMENDSANDNYFFHSYKIVQGFHSPVDAVLRDTSMYVIEVNFNGTQSLWRIDFPRYIDSTTSVSENIFNNEVIVYPNPANKSLNFSFDTRVQKYLQLKIYDQYSKLIFENNKINPKEKFVLNTSKFSQGIYYWNLLNTRFEKEHSGHFIIMH